MNMRNDGNYREISLEVNGYDRNYRNPLAKTYCYEYALYRTVSELFASVICSSRCIDSLNLYFAELPDGSDRNGSVLTEQASARKTRTKADYIKEVGELVKRDVIGHVTFPMMNICAAEVKTFAEADGTHTFLFTDGIYGFSVHIGALKKGRPEGITVKDLRRPKKQEEKEQEEKKQEGKRLVKFTKAA